MVVRVVLCLFLWSVMVVEGFSLPRPMVPTLREENEKILLSLNVEAEAVVRILDDPRMANIKLTERISELREAVGLSRVSLKKYLTAYPDVCIGMFSDKVKTAKSVVMRVLKVSEDEYAAGIKRILQQTNNKAGAIFRGNFPFIVDSLREMAGFTQADLTFLFNTYPTIFTLDYKTVASHLGFLRRTIGYSEEQLRLLLLRNCRSALCSDDRALALRSFFETELDISPQGFCELTVAHPRLFGVSLQSTLRPKIAQLLDDNSWGLSRERLASVIQRAPSVLTTPAATTRGVWELMHDQLGLSKTECQDVVRKFPNLLRVNQQSLQRKLCGLTLAELDLIAQKLSLGLGHSHSTASPALSSNEEAGQSTSQPTSIPHSSAAAASKPKKTPKVKQQQQQQGFDAEAEAEAEMLYRNVAGALLQRTPVALTCSLQRIEERMRAIGASKGLEAAAAVADHPSASSASASKLGGAALRVLLGHAPTDSLRRMSTFWVQAIDEGLDPFPVLPSAVTISDTKFQALLEARSTTHPEQTR